MRPTNGAGVAVSDGKAFAVALGEGCGAGVELAAAVGAVGEGGTTATSTVVAWGVSVATSNGARLGLTRWAAKMLAKPTR
jgi:hypothetical protein